MAATSELLQKLQRRRERMGERSPLQDIGGTNEQARKKDLETVKVQQRRILFEATEAANLERLDVERLEQRTASVSTVAAPSCHISCTMSSLEQGTIGGDVENLVPGFSHPNISIDSNFDKGASELLQQLQRRRKRMGEQFTLRGIDTSSLDSVTKDLEMVKVDERRTVFENSEIRITPPNANPGRLDLRQWEHQLDDGVPDTYLANPRRGSVSDSSASFSDSNESPDTTTELFEKLQRRRKRIGDVPLSRDGGSESTDMRAKDFEAVNVDERRSVFECGEMPDSQASVNPGRLDLSKWEEEIPHSKLHEALRRGRSNKYMSSEVSPRDCLADVSSLSQIAEPVGDTSTRSTDSNDSSNVGTDLLDNLQLGHRTASATHQSATVSRVNYLETVNVDERRSLFEGAPVASPRVSANPGRLDVSQWEEQRVDDTLVLHRGRLWKRDDASSCDRGEVHNLPVELDSYSLAKEVGCDAFAESLDSNALRSSCSAHDLQHGCTPDEELSADDSVVIHRTDHGRNDVGSIAVAEPCNLPENMDGQGSRVLVYPGRLDLSRWNHSLENDMLDRRACSCEPQGSRAVHGLSDSANDEAPSQYGSMVFPNPVALPSSLEHPNLTKAENQTQADSTEKLLLEACDMLAKSRLTSTSNSDSDTSGISNSTSEELPTHATAVDADEALVANATNIVHASSVMDSNTMAHCHGVVDVTSIPETPCNANLDKLDINGSQILPANLTPNEFKEHHLTSAVGEDSGRSADSTTTDSPHSSQAAPSEAPASKEDQHEPRDSIARGKCASASSTDSYSHSRTMATTSLIPTLARQMSRRSSAVLAVPASASSTATYIPSHYIVSQERADACASAASLDPCGHLGMSRIHSIGNISLGSRSNSQVGRSRHWPGRRLGPSTPCTPRSRSRTSSPNRQEYHRREA